jgi:hypothetical protein
MWLGGAFHDQEDVESIVIRRSIWGDDDTPCGRLASGRPIGRPGSGRPQPAYWPPGVWPPTGHNGCFLVTVD